MKNYKLEMATDKMIKKAEKPKREDMVKLILDKDKPRPPSTRIIMALERS